MYKIQEVNIDQFWHRFDANCEFRDGVNIIIGRNGTGKTTFMNILHAVLSVDIDSLASNDFESVHVTLSNGTNTRTVKARKVEDERFPFLIVEYQISRRKYRVRFVSTDDRRMALHYRRRAMEDSSEVRKRLSTLVSLSSLSVYRLRNSDGYEVRDRNGTRIVAPVDYRLAELMQRLTHYQLELSQKARGVSIKLQKDVLASILYSQEESAAQKYNLDFDKETEKRDLVSAYDHLNALDVEVKRKISFHVDSIDRAIGELDSIKNDNSSSALATSHFDIRPLEALRKTRKIIEMSLDAEKISAEIFSQINKFIDTLRRFIKEKKFEFDAGDLVVSNVHGRIDMGHLSSGEKQLLILLTEALLQRQQPHIFLADEPELSLHVEWQRAVIPAIMELNPNAQVIVATHSPEVASKYRDAIFNMEELVSA